jgi:putative iron-regulated protein
MAQQSLRLAAFAVAALIFVCAGCARREPDDPRRPIVATYADIVLATYEDSLATAQALGAAVDSLVAQPSEQNLAAAREKWRVARIPYSYSEAFRYYAGPIDGEGGPEGQLNGWPLDENHIDAVRAENYNANPGIDIVGNPKEFPQITPELIAAQNEAGGEKNIASGYHAIEFLLWGQDLNVPPESAGQRPFTDFVSGGQPDSVNTRRGQYLKAATQLLIADLEALVTAWRKPPPGSDNYRSLMVNGDVYTGLKRMLTGIATLAEVEMAGERMNVPLLSGDQEEEQSCFSDTTAADLRSDALGIEHVYFARYTRSDGTVVSGPSIAQLLQEKDPRMAQEMEARLTRTRETLAAIRDPFDREIQPDNKEGNTRVQAAIDALRAQTQSVTRAARALEIFLSPIETEGD